MIQQPSFDSTVSSLYQTLLEPQHWGAAIADVAQWFSASTASMFNYDFSSGIVTDLRVHGFDQEIARRYTNYYHALDPGHANSRAALVGQWLSDELLLDLRSPFHQEYVQDFALPNGIGSVAGCKISAHESSCLWLGLQRRPGERRFGDEARRRYESLAPHLRRVGEVQSKLKALALGDALAKACLDRLDAGVIVVDKARHAKLVNARGLRLLGRELTISNQKLRCNAPALDELLGRLIAHACAVMGKGGAMRVPRHDGLAQLLLNVLPIPHSHELATLLPEPLGVVVIGDPATDAPPIDVCRSLFSLSTAEAALMAALARGTSVGEWAHLRNTSVATVRTQLRSLFDKTGTDSQARLVALVKAIPPMS